MFAQGQGVSSVDADGTPCFLTSQLGAWDSGMCGGVEVSVQDQDAFVTQLCSLLMGTRRLRPLAVPEEVLEPGELLRQK